MPISWNEIRHNAIKFSREWAGVKSESAEKQTFWNEFFQVFGIRRRVVASFEEAVKKISGDYGRIDLLWPGILLVEHKSFGEDLHKAETQAFKYIRDLANDPKRHDEIPRYIVVTDFARIAIHDLEPEEQRDLPLFDRKRGVTHVFPLAEFHENVQHFAFIPGYKQHTLQEQDPINIEAVQIMGELHDALETGGYSGHDLERFLVRVLFCLFAEDTGIFERESFHLFVENRTKEDGSDLGLHLARLFQVLNTPPAQRQANLDESLAAFPYVNGDLFGEHLGFADFNRDMRNALLACTRKDWSRISPAIFGSLFQSIMKPKTRRQIGAHYTSERDILKVIRSLFLDELRAEFKSRKTDRSTARRTRLEEFHAKLCKLTFFDPACGCGNFLVIGYRELRQLELETLKELLPSKEGKFQQVFSQEDVAQLTQVDVDQYYGIEIGEWPARIAEVALWLMDHQMNLKVSGAFGQLYQRLPLKKSPHIHCGNALRLDWKTILPPDKCSYVLGNPPFVGKHYQNTEQKADMVHVFGDFSNTGDLDYVSAWFVKAGAYAQDTRIRIGFVATNSITQGEQVPVLWGILFQRFHLKIHFGHRPFAWMSEAKGKAHVHVVIIGLGVFDVPRKLITDYDVDPKSPVVSQAANIMPYLIPGPDRFVTKRRKPLADVPAMRCGNKPTDDGNFILTDAERVELLREEPNAGKFIRQFLGSDEFINGISRWCIWLRDASPDELRALPRVMERVRRVRDFRAGSTAKPTQQAATTATLFFYISQPNEQFIAIPEVSSERRKYIPIGFLPPDVIVSNKIYVVSSSNFFLFGVMSSVMHMAWVSNIGGRLESRYQYSGTMNYNPFPWPNSSPKQRERVEEKARAVLAARELHLPPHGLATLADLYDPLAMPPGLLKAHTELDRAVEKCYRAEPFHSNRERVEFLFSLYEKLTAPLLPITPKTKGRRVDTVTKPQGKQKTPALYGQKLPQGKSTPESEANAAHFYFTAKEEPTKQPE